MLQVHKILTDNIKKLLAEKNNKLNLSPDMRKLEKSTNLI